MKKLFVACLLLCFFLTAQPIYAVGDVLGIHILQPYEIDEIDKLLKTDQNKENWSYVTIPFSLQDIPKHQEWQDFFDKCKEKKIIPIVRLTTIPEGDSWKIPTKKDVVDLTRALSKLEWPTQERIVIIFNEPNHAKEWGYTINPQEYAQVLEFSANWLHTEQKNYYVLPAAMDLAAPNGSTTMEAFTYWQKAVTEVPEIFDLVDGWNSHSYPNPGFSSNPNRTTKDSLRGYQHELTFVKKYTDKELPVYITETGWVENRNTSRNLANYYDYANKNIWNDPRIKAVTPFLLRGAPGPFASFSFLDEQGKETKQFDAYRKILEKNI